ALERPQNQTAGLHLLNELAEITPGRLATFERSHRLLDDHESAVHDAQTGIVAGVSYKGSLHASNDLQTMAEELCDRIAAGRSTDDLGMFQRAREIQVIRAFVRNGDPYAKAIRFIDAPQRRIIAHHVCPFDDDVG